MRFTKKLNAYNATVRNRLVMSLRPDYSFTGYIRVELELTRPVQTHDEIIYLPKNTVKAIHLTSANTAHQVILALLQKVRFLNFNVFFVYISVSRTNSNGTCRADL